MHSNYKIIRTIFENVYQRVLECKDNDTGDIFYSNIITSQKVINLINLEEMKNIASNVLECYNTEDRIYIYTKPLNSELKSLRELQNNNLTLKQQFKLSESVIDLAHNIFNMTDIVQQKVLDIDRLYVDAENKVVVDLNLIFEQEYDIADNETFKRLGNIIHYVFSKSEIVDYNISDSIPPDILKIIVRCLTREYIFPNDITADMKASPIYKMIFDSNQIKHTDKINKTEAEKEKNIKKTQEEVKIPEEISSEAIKEVLVDDDFKYNNNSSIFDIYVNDNNSNDHKIKDFKSLLTKKEITRIAASILIVVLVLLIGNKLIKAFNSKEANTNVNNDTQNEQTNSPLAEEPLEQIPNEIEITDSTEMYFNDELFKNINYSGNKATIDNDVFVEGMNSLLVANEQEGKIKALFAAVDFRDEKFNYMLKKQISIAAKIKSENDLTAQIVLEAYKDGVLTSNFHTSAQIYNDIWSQFTIPINVTDADSLNIYIEYEGKNKVWLDSIYIDVIK